MPVTTLGERLAVCTPTQRAIYLHIRSSIVTTGRGPTFRDIGAAFGIRSPNGVTCHLKALTKKGLITRDKTHRGIFLVDPLSCPHCGKALAEPKQETSVGP